VGHVERLDEVVGGDLPDQTGPGEPLDQRGVGRVEVRVDIQMWHGPTFRGEGFERVGRPPRRAREPGAESNHSDTF
jgi:hypothetical protein